MNHIVVMEKPRDNIINAINLFERIKNIKIDYSKEHFLVFSLDTKNRVIKSYIVSIGILDASLIHPREVFRDAIKDNAKSIIVAHNHPSGSLEPSINDIEVMKGLRDAGIILGIDLLDSIIFTQKDFISMKEQGKF